MDRSNKNISHIYISNKSESESGQCFILFCDSFLMIENRVMRIKRRISILLILHFMRKEILKQADVIM